MAPIRRYVLFLFVFFIDNGLLGLTLQAIVLWVGSSDSGSSPADIIQGIVDCAHLIASKKPQTQVFVLKLLPSGRLPNKWRETVSAVNSGLDASLASLSQSPTNIKTIDIDPGFLGQLYRSNL